MSHYTDWYDGPDPGDWKEWEIDPPERWEYVKFPYFVLDISFYRVTPIVKHHLYNV
jgi:hypothetical protein